MYRVMIALSLGALLTLGSCGAKKGSPEFEKKFSAAKQQSGLPDVQIIDTRKGTDLKDNVQRLGDPVAPPEADTQGKIPIKLSQNYVGLHIRRQIARLSECHEAVRGKAGKAIVTVKIMASGRVEEVNVEAPDFQGTRLASCLREGALRWRFPQFKTESISYSYPFIFR